jgi:CO dehydrogenase nickel-insertion accessory protein CooC1
MNKINPNSLLKKLTIRKTMNQETSVLATVEINKSIMELNFRKEKLQREVDDIQSQIHFLANLRESQRMTDDEQSGQSLFDQMFGGTD